MTQIARRGIMFVLSSPSGAGKTTLSRRLVEADPNISMSISVTTRPRRPGEVNGQDYMFVGLEAFSAMRDRGELLEHAKVFGNYYGTPKKPVEEALAEGRDVLFDIDWQGTQQLEKTARDDLVRVFILPPTMRDLERRLETRAQDSPTVVAQRMARAADEMSHWAEYDYVIINDDVDVSLAHVRAILDAERLRRHRLTGLNDFVTGLRNRL